jgi:serine/threonine protein kinase
VEGRCREKLLPKGAEETAETLTANGRSEEAVGPSVPAARRPLALSSQSKRSLRTAFQSDADIGKFYVCFFDDEKLEGIGVGTFASVYSARQKVTRAIVAINGPFHTRDDLKQSSASEVTLLATLHHPAILPLRGCTPFDGEPAILTPFMEASVELKGFAQDFWTSRQKQDFLLGIAFWMAFMHANRFIHRGLKPANVLLDRACEPRIGDLGVSKDRAPGDAVAVDAGGSPSSWRRRSSRTAASTSRLTSTPSSS